VITKEIRVVRRAGEEQVSAEEVAAEGERLPPGGEKGVVGGEEVVFPTCGDVEIGSLTGGIVFEGEALGISPADGAGYSAGAG